jgi:hypothetical protein
MAEQGDAYYAYYDEQRQPSSGSGVPFPASRPGPSPSASTAPTAVISSFFARGAKFFNKASQLQLPKSPSSQQPPESLASSSPPRAAAPRSRLRNVSGPSNLRPILPANSAALYSQPNHLAARSVTITINFSPLGFATE